MTILPVKNIFNAPVYHEETVTSTMDVSRELAAEGKPHGTVITADFQQAGRGRGGGRVWQMESKVNLPFTILLRFPRAEDIPSALTLRIGLAVSIGIEFFCPALKGKVKVKWPNDIMIDGKKAAGILCEADGGVVHAGVGINVAQKEFPPELQGKAASVALASGAEIMPEERFALLEQILSCLFLELETDIGWNSKIDLRLFKKGEQVTFIEGAAGSGKQVTGILKGISASGEIIINDNKYAAGEVKNL